MSKNSNQTIDHERKVYKILGSPGSGKTTRVVGNPELNIKGLFLENSDEYPFEEQMLVTYTNAGVDEAADRLYEMTDHYKYKIEDRVTTIHSRSFQLLDLDREQVVTHDKKEGFCKKYDLEFGFDDDEDDIMGADMDEGNALFRMYSWIQSNRLTLSEWEECPMEWEWNSDPKYLMQEWIKHKQKNDYVGFGDMIQGVVEWGKKILIDHGYGPVFDTDSVSAIEVFEKAAEEDFEADKFRGRGPFVDTKVLYVDEVQDLTALQYAWYLLQKLVSKKVYLGGDEDQTIYGYSGADPKYFLNEEGELEVLERTYRIPEPIWEVCNGVIDQVDVREGKDVTPDGKDGEFELMRDPNIKKLVQEMHTGEWMVLFRARYQIDEFREEFLHKYGIPYDNMSTFDTWSGDIPKLRDALYRIERGNGRIKGAEVDALVEYADDSMLLRNNNVTETEKAMGNFGNGMDIEMLDDILKLTRYGTQVPLTASNYLDITEEINYYEKEAILGNIQADKATMSKERVRIGTIHSAKGKEAPNVLIATASTPTIMDNMSEDLGIMNAGTAGRPITDAERRVYYVGMTRASQKLILAEGLINALRLESDDDFNHNVFISAESLLDKKDLPKKDSREKTRRNG